MQGLCLEKGKEAGEDTEGTGLKRRRKEMKGKRSGHDEKDKEEMRKGR